MSYCKRHTQLPPMPIVSNLWMQTHANMQTRSNHLITSANTILFSHVSVARIPFEQKCIFNYFFEKLPISVEIIYFGCKTLSIWISPLSQLQ